MKQFIFTVILAVVAPCLAAPSENSPTGGVVARVDQGSLGRWETWWSPDPGWEGRFWTEEGASGSAWVRLGPLQAGPLVGSAGPEGQRKWSRDGGSPSGRWGLALDLDQGGLWAVQGPGTFEAGAQVRATTGPWALAAGGDRTWDLTEDPAGGPRWADRYRAGATWRSDPASGGLEATVSAPVGDSPGISFRGRGRWEPDPWSLRGEGAASVAQGFWKASAQAGWGPWGAGWSGDHDDPVGRAEARWSPLGGEVRVAWGPGSGGDLGVRGHARAGALDWEAGAGAAVGPGGQTGRLDAGIAGPWGPGRWSASWGLGPGDPDPIQTVTAGWRQPSFETEARWKVTGLRLGWLGPGTSFTMTMKILF